MDPTLSLAVETLPCVLHNCQPLLINILLNKLKLISDTYPGCLDELIVVDLVVFVYVEVVENCC